MEHLDDTHKRLTDLKVKASFTEDLHDHLEQVIVRQQRKGSGNPSSFSPVKLPKSRLVNQPRGRGEHGSRTNAALSGGGGGMTGGQDRSAPSGGARG